MTATRRRRAHAGRLSPVLLLAGALLAAPPALSAHDIPADVTVRVFVKPEGTRLRVLVRVPLRALTDVEYPRRDGDFVDLAGAGQALHDAAAVFVGRQVAVFEEATPLDPPHLAAVRISLESDRSFDAYDRALAHTTGAPLPAATSLLWEQGLLDALFEYRVVSDRSRFSIDAAFDRFGLQVVTLLQFVPPAGTPRTFQLDGDAGLVRLDPRWHQVAGRFVALGFGHILEGADHLLFLLCLVIPLRRAGVLVAVVTAFTLAHSVTLIASAYDVALPGAAWFPPLVDTLIAASIVYMALENILAPAIARRWAMAFGFGLVHGFGFAFALRDATPFAGSHLLLSLLSFNVGVELGQLLVLAILVPALALAFRFVVAERLGAIVLSALVAHTGWHWMLDRVDLLRQVPFDVSALDPADAAAALRLLLVLVLAGGGAWLARTVAAHVRAVASRRGAGQLLRDPS
jgi:hypothetical protein